MSDIQRKLVSVRRISSIDPIEGADNIVCATVDGWKLVTQKSNNFKPGDLVVYFEIDSFIPISEKFDWLRKSSYKKMGDKEGYRLKTIRLKGQVSQGLILPLSEVLDHEVGEGSDLTEFLGVVKWDPPLPAQLAGTVKGNFPSFIQKTDQERIQNCFSDLFNNYETTLKLDGSSMTVYYKGTEDDDSYYLPVGVCSRNLELVPDETNSFWKVVRDRNIVGAMREIGKNIALQGELLGPGVQGNREGLKELQFYLFDIYDITNSRYMSPYERNIIFKLLVEAGADIEHVPIIDHKISLSNFNSVDKFLEYADRPSINHPIAEGVVFKPHKGNNTSFKVINNKFLLNEK